jgi:hypothetical protein
MLVSIGAYDICDGTLAGGVAISDLRPANTRLFDVVVPLDNDVTLFDRTNTTCDLTLTVARTHASLQDSEQFILQLDNNLPTSGAVTFTTTGPTPTTRTIPNGFIVSHELIQEQGSTTFHQYRIVGGPPV